MPILQRRPLIVGLLALSISTALPALGQEAQPAAPGARVVSFEGEASLAELAAKGPTVLFFYAAWCPDCRATVGELKSHWSDVRSDLTLVIADYDKEKDLKARFSVTYQDTFVLLDSRGDAVRSWNGGGVQALNQNTAS